MFKYIFYLARPHIAEVKLQQHSKQTKLFLVSAFIAVDLAGDQLLNYTVFDGKIHAHSTHQLNIAQH